MVQADRSSGAPPLDDNLERPAARSHDIASPMTQAVASAAFTLDAAHFRAHYEAWLSSVSRSQKGMRRMSLIAGVLAPVAVTLGVAGVAPRQLIPLAAGLLAAAAMGAGFAFSHRRKTLRTWEKSPAMNTRVEFSFARGLMVQTNADAPHKLKMEPTTFHRARDGFFFRSMRAEQMRSIYVPYRAITTELALDELFAVLSTPREG